MTNSADCLNFEASNAKLASGRGMTSPAFVEKYMARLDLDVSMFGAGGSPIDYNALCKLTEAHLAHIPFENLAQHGGRGGPVKLNLASIERKLLDRKRGGFCLELNALFASLLRELGLQVVIVPAVVYKEEKGGFDHPPTHVLLIVTLPGDGLKYFVDVGFGEPPCHPLIYHCEKEQLTAEGMKSRLIKRNEMIALEWYKDGIWMSRLQWSWRDSITTDSPELETFQGILDLVHHPDSNFSGKLIVCIVNTSMKTTLAGDKLKVTGPPRFPPNGEVGNGVRVSHIGSRDEARQILADKFAISYEETEYLHWQKIVVQDPKLFATF